MVPGFSTAGGWRACRAFTLIELLIVITIIAIVAAIAVPNILSARMNANEAAAISVLRTITTAEAQFIRSAKADEDSDAQGEYGYLGELSGVAGVRGGSAKVPTDLTASMATVSLFGEVNRSGYWFRLYLPEPGGVGHREKAGGGVLAGVLDPDLAEQYWGVYAWPSNYGISATRTFFVNQQGEISQTDAATNSGANSANVMPGNALRTSDLTLMTGRLAIGTRGGDGNLWKQIQ